MTLTRWGQTTEAARWTVRTTRSQADRAEFRNCGKVEVAVLGPPSLISLMGYVDVKQH